MKIELHEIPVREVTNGYVNSDIEGVVGYSGKLGRILAIRLYGEKR